jgi:hypothetical protein
VPVCSRKNGLWGGLTMRGGGGTICLEFWRGKVLRRPAVDKRQVHVEGSELGCLWAADLVRDGGGGGGSCSMAPC